MVYTTQVAFLFVDILLFFFGWSLGASILCRNDRKENVG